MAESQPGGELWRIRLKEAVERSGKSRRSVSLEAGCGAGYLHDVIAVGKEPTIDRLIRIAGVLGVSLPWLLGVDTADVPTQAPSGDFRDMGDGNAWLTINRAVPFDVALKVMQLLGPRT